MTSIQFSSLNDMNASVGIIYPPPEIRYIVDRTASFVAKNGIDFEYKLKQREVANPRFNFLNTNDPYHEYYKYRIREFMSSSGIDDSGNFNKGAGSEPIRISINDLLPISNPPPDPEFIANPTTFQAIDIDIIRLTALFVAFNGRKFLMNLINREQKNYQFDFLRPQHSNFIYFTKLVEQYTKIILPTKSMIKELDHELDYPTTIMDKVKCRLDWYKFQDREKRREMEMAEKERMSYSQIDWHDFVIVDTIEFRLNEKGDLPPPTTPDDVGARILKQERSDKLSESSAKPLSNFLRPKISKTKPPHHVIQENEDDEVYMLDLSKIPDEFKKQELINKSTECVGQQDNNHEKNEELYNSSKETILIRKNYDPKDQRTNNTDSSYLLSPFTQKKINSDHVHQHMKIEMLSSNWKGEKERKFEEKKEQSEVYVSGDAIDNSLKSIAERRSDIFGDGGIEIAIGKKISEANDHTSNSVSYDGYSNPTLNVNQETFENIADTVSSAKKPRME